MCDDDFIPFSNIYGIAGTSYRIQLGMKHNKWTILLLKAKIILDYHIFKDTTIDKLPERDRIVNWILITIPFDINPLHAIRTVTLLLQEADGNKEKKKEIAPIEDCIRAKEELKKIEGTDLKRPLDLEEASEGKSHQTVTEKLHNILNGVIIELERVVSVLKKIIQDDFSHDLRKTYI